MSSSLLPHGLYSPWNSPGQNTGVGSHSLLQGISSTQGLNPGFPHCRWILYHLSHQKVLVAHQVKLKECALIPKKTLQLQNKSSVKAMSQQKSNDSPICKTEKETQMYRTDFWTLWEKARVGCFKRTASKHVYYLG